MAMLYLLVLLCYIIYNNRIQGYKVNNLFNSKISLTKYQSYENCKSLDITIRNNKIKTFELYGFSDYDESKSSGLSLKVVGVLILGIVGIFGTDIIGSFSSMKNALTEQSKPAVVSELKNVSKDGANRGALTRLTRKEINYKLAQIPVFYVTSDDGQSIYVKDNKGQLFSDKNSAFEYMKTINDNEKSLGLKVKATTLDTVYYPLIVKKQKIGSYMEGVSSKSDINAIYELNGSLDQIAYTSSQWQSIHEHDFPLFRMPGLAFNKPEGLEIPLFLNKEDAITTYKRLLESREQEQQQQAVDLLKQKDDNNLNKPMVIPEVQVSSVLDMISLFSSGGFEGRSIEFYPSIESINSANELF